MGKAQSTEPAKARQGRDTASTVPWHILCVCPRADSEGIVHTTMPAGLPSLAQRAPQALPTQQPQGCPLDTPALPSRNPAQHTTAQGWGAKQHSPLFWETWITSVFPREQRPTSFPAREDGNHSAKLPQQQQWHHAEATWKLFPLNQQLQVKLFAPVPQVQSSPVFVDIHPTRFLPSACCFLLCTLWVFLFCISTQENHPVNISTACHVSALPYHQSQAVSG